MVKGSFSTHCKYGHEFTDDNIIYRKRDRGHGEEISRICKICHNLRNKKQRSKVEYNKKFSLYLKEYRLNNKDLVKNGRLKLKYGITLDEYNIILTKQNGKCLICNLEKDVKYLCVDHDHNTGKIRGLLCSRCNGVLGWYEKYKENINNYLEK